MHILGEAMVSSPLNLRRAGLILMVILALQFAGIVKLQYTVNELRIENKRLQKYEIIEFSGEGNHTYTIVGEDMTTIAHKEDCLTCYIQN